VLRRNCGVGPQLGDHEALGRVSWSFLLLRHLQDLLLHNLLGQSLCSSTVRRRHHGRCCRVVAHAGAASRGRVEQVLQLGLQGLVLLLEMAGGFVPLLLGREVVRISDAGRGVALVEGVDVRLATFVCGRDFVVELVPADVEAVRLDALVRMNR